MNRLYTVPLFLCFILITSACSPTLSPEDVVHIDVHYDDQLVLSLSDKDEITTILSSLSTEPTTDNLEEYDLAYTMEIRTYEALITYKLLFNRRKEKAMAMSTEGAFSIPFSWLDDYLTALPIPEAFPQYMPPELNITIDGYLTKPGYDQLWQVHPTQTTAYNIEDHMVYSENFKTDQTDFDISGEFDHRNPSRLSLDIIGLDGTEHFESVTLDHLPSPSKHGVYRYELSAFWEDPAVGYSGEIMYHFGVSIELPETYTLNKSSFQPGDCIALLIENPDALDYTVKTSTYDKTIGLFNYGSNLIGLIPLDSRLEPGQYAIEITQTSTGTPLASIAYEVVYKEFQKQYLTVNNTTADLKSDENQAKDNAKFGDAKAYSVGEQLWEGTFLQPVQGRISTEYAMMRYVNGAETSYRHSGIDIAAPEGTPIMAANNGIVTFASDLIISGNVVVLDHGYGLFTSYVHMHKIYVQDGDVVKKGDIIGEVGTTGYSTGPHLHWSVWKNGVYLNPWKFIDEDPLAIFENKL